MKKAMMIVGGVVLYFMSVFGGAVFGYNAGYDDAMLEVQTRVLEGVDKLGDMLNVETK